MPDDDAPAVWETIAAEARTLHGDPARTLEPRERSVGSTARRALETYASDNVRARERRLVLGDVLGAGGRGVVRLATQTSLGREVAVKGLRPGLHGERPTLELFQEAWVAGQLEHPNIVPVYDVTVDEEAEGGAPLIVLKRIEGESWATLLHDPELARQRLDVAEGDLLDAHLQVLMAVCNAIHFAHDRRILHLDLKPENVMLGRHGEVYVVDWGMAAALEDDGSGKLPLVAQRRGICGTPSYMAPEMTYGEGERLDERTDVYLLGATLFELLAGTPPHQGETMMEVLHAVVHDEPQLPAHAPAELAAICQRAMARDSGERYPDAGALRRALQSFVSHRGSSRLAEQAARRLVELEAMLSKADDEADDESQPQPGRTRQDLLAQVRFGFEQALASWPANEAAREGLRRAFTLVIEYELAHGDPQVAASLAVQVDALPDALQHRVDEAVARRRAGLQELEQLRRDQDVRIGQRTRVFVFTVLGLLWTLAPLAFMFLRGPRVTEDDFGAYTGTMVASLLLLGFFRWWARDSLTRTRTNRFMITAFALTMTTDVALLLGSRAIGMTVEQVLIIHLLIAALAIALTALTVDRRGLVIAVVHLAMFGVSAASPALLLPAIAGGNFAFMLVIAVIWRPERMRGRIPEPDHRA